MNRKTDYRQRFSSGGHPGQSPSVQQQPYFAFDSNVNMARPLSPAPDAGQSPKINAMPFDPQAYPMMPMMQGYGHYSPGYHMPYFYYPPPASPIPPMQDEADAATDSGAQDEAS